MPMIAGRAVSREHRAPNVAPIVGDCRRCGTRYYAYGPDTGRCGQRACQPNTDLIDAPVTCWAPDCAARPRYVLEWTAPRGPRREVACARHLPDLTDYSLDTSAGFEPPVPSRLPTIRQETAA